MWNRRSLSLPQRSFLTQELVPTLADRAGELWIAGVALAGGRGRVPGRVVEALAAELRALGFGPLPSHANFVFVPVDDPEQLGDGLLMRAGCAVRVGNGGIRITVNGPEQNDLLLTALAGELATRSR